MEELLVCRVVHLSILDATDQLVLWLVSLLFDVTHGFSQLLFLLVLELLVDHFLKKHLFLY